MEKNTVENVKWSDVFHFFIYLKPYLTKQILILFFIFMASFLNLMNPLLTKVLIDNVGLLKDITLLKLIILIWIFIYILNAISAWASTFLSGYSSMKLQLDLRKHFFKHLQELTYPNFRKKQPKDYFYCGTSDIENIKNMLISTIPEVVRNFLTFLFLLCLTFSLNWKLTLLSLSVIPFIQRTTQTSSNKLQQFEFKKRNKDAELVSTIQENISLFKLIKIHNSNRFEIQKLIVKIIEIIRIEFQKIVILAKYNTVQGFLQSTWAISMSWIGWNDVIEGEMSIGELMAITMYLFQLHTPVRTLASIYQQLKLQAVSCNRVVELLRLQPTNNLQTMTVSREKFESEIRLKNVSFEYEKNIPVLKNISLTIPKKAWVAFVGDNGSGKSTTLDLVLNYIRPQEGTIYMDDIAIDTISSNSYSKIVTAIPQESYFFSGTIKDNIIYNYDIQDENELMRIAEIVYARNFIEQLPLKFDTPINSGQISFSGGEMQKILLMRALVRNPQILILDEATSAIDIATEKQIFENIRKMFIDLTLIIVSHRLTAIRAANEIVVFNKGRIVEKGTHLELMDKKGHYFKMYEAGIIRDNGH